MLLQGVLDDGRLTDGKGRLVSFANTVIIMTSNLGSDALLHLAQEAQAQGKPFDRAAATAACMHVLRQRMRPEFLNRLDDVVVFEPLSQDQLRFIAKLQVGSQGAPCLCAVAFRV